MELRPLPIPGAWELRPDVHADDRGRLVKPFVRDRFAERGLVADFAEDVYSVSRRGVVRGMHFQVPPRAQVRLVYCTLGEVMDVLLDLRIGSPTYGEASVVELSDRRANSVYIPEGLAHGFLVRSEMAVLQYKISVAYSRDHEGGVHWKSVAAPWPDEDVVVSARDQGFPSLDSFRSPFRWEATA